MAIVVELADRQSQMPRRPIKGPVEAQILLFTGVRYERLEEPTVRGRGGSSASQAKKKH